MFAPSVSVPNAATQLQPPHGVEKGFRILSHRAGRAASCVQAFGFGAVGMRSGIPGCSSCTVVSGRQSNTDERGMVDDAVAVADGVSVRVWRETVETARALEELPHL